MYGFSLDSISFSEMWFCTVTKRDGVFLDLGVVLAFPPVDERTGSLELMVDLPLVTVFRQAAV